jgi:hypothetical protein
LAIIVGILPLKALFSNQFPLLKGITWGDTLDSTKKELWQE